jgi:hypothetical protein
VTYLPASSTVLEGLAAFMEERASPELCFHLHVCAAGSVVLQWYDAFDLPCYVSKSVPAERLAAFCARLSIAFAEGPEA